MAYEDSMRMYNNIQTLMSKCFCGGDIQKADFDQALEQLNLMTEFNYMVDKACAALFDQLSDYRCEILGNIVQDVASEFGFTCEDTDMLKDLFNAVDRKVICNILD